MTFLHDLLATARCLLDAHVRPHGIWRDLALELAPFPDLPPGWVGEEEDELAEHRRDLYARAAEAQAIADELQAMAEAA